MLKSYRGRMLLTSFGALCIFAGSSAAVAADFHAVLNGSKELTGGDPDGWARVKVNINDQTNRLCADLETRDIGKITGVNIYRGAPVDKSEPVVKIETPDDNDSDDCDNIGDALADEIQAHPSNFFISVRTVEHPNGALAGKLMPGEYKS